MIKTVSDVLRHAVERYLPEAFALTAMLTLLTFALGMTITDQAANAMVTHWYNGFW